MLLVNGHKLLACSRIFHIEVGQRQITGNRCLLEFYLFNIICVDILGHQFHIVITEKVRVNIVDKSKPGTLAGADGKIAQWNYKIYDPDNNVIYQTGWITFSEPRP